jgi:hypothetical protein
MAQDIITYSLTDCGHPVTASESLWTERAINTMARYGEAAGTQCADTGTLPTGGNNANL